MSNIIVICVIILLLIGGISYLYYSKDKQDEESKFKVKGIDTIWVNHTFLHVGLPPPKQRLVVNTFEKKNKEDVPQTLWFNGSGNICAWQGEYFICEEIDTGRIFRANEDLEEIESRIGLNYSQTLEEEDEK